MWLFFVPQPEPFMKVDSDKSNAEGKSDTNRDFLLLQISICHTLDLPEYLWFGQIPNPLQLCKELLISRLWPKLMPPPPHNYIFTWSETPPAKNLNRCRVKCKKITFFVPQGTLRKRWNPLFWTNSNFSQIVSFSTQVRKVVRHLKLEIKYWTNTQKLMTHK